MLQLTCNNCGKSAEDLLKCGGCQATKYCDKHCQRKDWPLHKQVCHRPPSAGIHRIIAKALNSFLNKNMSVFTLYAHHLLPDVARHRKQFFIDVQLLYKRNPHTTRSHQFVDIQVIAKSMDCLDLSDAGPQQQGLEMTLDRNLEEKGSVLAIFSVKEAKEPKGPTQAIRLVILRHVGQGQIHPPPTREQKVLETIIKGLVGIVIDNNMV